MEHLNLNQHVQYLRLQLLEMSRVSQRAVDYSTKAHGLGGADFCANARNGAFEVDQLYREITESTNELLLADLPSESDLRFVLSANHICEALYNIYAHAGEIATLSMRLLENASSRDIRVIAMGEEVNRMVRLSVVALFEQEVEFAKMTLPNQCFELFCGYSLYDDNESVEKTQERIIARHLQQITLETNRMNDAISFWLEGMDYECSPHQWLTPVADRKIRENPARKIRNLSERYRGSLAHYCTDRTRLPSLRGM